MGGVRCAKEIIDNFAGVTHQVECMKTSIHFAGEFDGSGLRPTEEQRDAFFKAGDELVKVASEIQLYVSSDTRG